MRSGKVAVTFAVLLVVSFAVMNAMPSDTLPAALLQEAVLALVAFAAVGFAIPDALECCTKSVQQRNTVRFTATALLLAGLVGGAITLLAWLFAGGGTMACFASTALPSTADLMENLLLLLGICLLTGLYEESYMRVLGIEAFERALDTKRAILASAALFALLHVGALLFGVIMGALYVRTRRLWPCAFIHAGFDVLYLAPNVLLTGTMPETYASGAVGDTVLLAVSVLMLSGIVLKIRKEIA